MVVVGETLWLPETGTDPIPLSIETDVAPEVLQVNVELWPLLIKFGFAVKLTPGPAVALTVIFTLAFVTTPLVSQN